MQRPIDSPLARTTPAPLNLRGERERERKANREETADASAPMLQLYLFGPLRAYVDGEVAIDEQFTRHKAKALLALLYLDRGRYISGEDMLDRLWPNHDQLPADSGRLKQTVLVLRRALERARSRPTG